MKAYRQFYQPLLATLITLVIITGCASEQSDQKEKFSPDSLQDNTGRIATIEGKLAGTEAVRYDAEQDVYFISNFNGSASAADSNGFIAKALPNGTIDSLAFMTGTANAPLHSPRGMYIKGDTLFVADLNGLHRFNTQTGKQLKFNDLSSFKPGFLNDVAVMPNGSVYITDTGQSRVYKVKGSNVTVALDSLGAPPNGITWDANNNQLVIAPWNSVRSFRSFTSGDTVAKGFITVTSGGNFDGIEPYKDSFIVASQNDSTLYQIYRNGSAKPIITTAPKPADIALDTKRNRIAVPYISLNKVDIWQLEN